MESSMVIGIPISPSCLQGIERFLSSLKNDCLYSFVLFQYSGSSFDLVLYQSLSEKCAMKVDFVKHNSHLNTGHIHIIPYGYALHINDGVFKLKKIKTGEKLGLDQFFTTLAKTYKHNSAALILGCTKRIGEKGMADIHKHTGCVLIIDPAEQDDNELAFALIRLNIVDQVLSITELSKLFNSHQLHQCKELLLNDKLAYYRIITNVYQQTGADFSKYKKKTLIRRIQKRMSTHNIDDIHCFMDFIEHHPAEAKALKDEFLIHVTDFFRDKEAFHIIQTRVLPHLFESIPHDQDLRFWVAGCSTGEEVYSLAICIEDYLLKNKIHRSYKIFATDIDNASLVKASAGVFNKKMMTGLDKELLSRYFTLSNSGYTIIKAIRENIVFAYHNLLSDPPFINIDLVSCRNLLIYLQLGVQQKILGNFLFSLKKGSILFLGTSESLGNLQDNFLLMDQKWKLFICNKSKRIKRPHQATKRELSVTNFSTPTKELKTMVKKEPGEIAFIKYLSDNHTPSSFFIDSSYNLIYSKGNAKRYFKFRDGLFQPNILKLLETRTSSIIKQGVQKVIQNKQNIRLKNVELNSHDETFRCDISIQFVSSDALPECFLIQFEEEQRIDSTIMELDYASYGEDPRTHIADLENELEQTKKEVEEAERERELIKEQVQASNEELLTSNEELQATNEELQSVNEELYTVNVEMQEKNKSLVELNNDITNLLNCTDYGTLFLDRELRIRKFTSALNDVLQLETNDIGRPITSYAFNFDGESRAQMISDFHQVLRNITPIEKELSDKEGQRFLMKITPFITNDKTIDGVVVTFVNITQLRQIEDKLNTNQRRFKLLLDEMPDGFAFHKMVYDENGKAIDYRFLEVNQAFEKITGLKKKSILGNTVTQSLASINQVWITKYAKVAETQEAVHFIDYSKELDKYFSIVAYSTKPGYFATIFKDITEEHINSLRIKESQQALKESQARLDMAITAGNQGFFDVNVVSGEAVVNKEYAEMLGYDHKTFVESNTSWLKRIHPHDRAFVKKTFFDYVEGKLDDYRVEFRCCTKSGKYIWILAVGKIVEWDDNGAPLIMMGSHTNITELKNTQIQLELSEKRYTLALDAAEEGIWDWDIEKDTVFYSDQWKKQLGYQADELKNEFKTWHKLLHPDDKTKSLEALNSFIQKPNGHFVLEFRLRHKDGKFRWIRSKASAIMKNGKPVRMLGAHTDITFAKRAQTKIEHAKQRFILTNEASRTGIWDWNLMTNQLYLSPIWKDHLGYKENELDNSFATWESLLHPNDKQRALTAVSDFMKKPTDTFNIQFRLRHKNGSYRWINSKASTTIKDGKLTRMFGAHMDITDLMEVTERLKKSEQQLRKIFDTISDGMVISDKDGNILELNTAASQMYGFSRDEILNLNASNVVTDEFKADQQKFIKKVLKDGYSKYETIDQKKDGTTFYTDVRGNVIDYNGETCILAAIRDITDIRKTEKELLKFNQALHQAPVPIVITDVAGYIEYANPKYYEISGYTNKELRGKKTDVLKSGYHTNDFYKELWEIITSGNTWRGEFFNKRKNNEYFWELASISPILDSNKNIQNFVKISEDITKNKLIENELKQAKEKAETANIHKNNFLANMSHEIRTPMNGIIGFAELLKEDDISDKDKESYLEIINSNSNTLLRLIDDIIDVSKIEANELKINKQPCRVAKIFEESYLQLLKLKKQQNKDHLEIKLIQSEKIDDLSLITDPLRLKQVLNNFTNNALKFTDKGSISIEVKLHAKTLEVAIRDTGIGIPEESKSELFKRFQRVESKAFRKFSGTGLGLTISKGIVQLLGGKVWFNSSYGKGSDFHFTLPLKNSVEKYESDQAIISLNHHKDLNNTCILIAEDEKQVYQYFKDTLRNYNSELIWAEDGERVVETFKEKRADIDLIIMDINMPKKDGITAIQEILQIDPSVKIIVQTGYAKREEEDKCKALGCMAYITKPILPNDLISILTKYI